MDAKKSVPLDKLLQAVSLGNVEDDVLSSIAARLARLDKDASDADRAKVVELSGGKTLRDLARGIVEALNIDAIQDHAVRRRQLCPQQHAALIGARLGQLDMFVGRDRVPRQDRQPLGATAPLRGRGKHRREPQRRAQLLRRIGQLARNLPHFLQRHDIGG